MEVNFAWLDRLTAHPGARDGESSSTTEQQEPASSNTTNRQRRRDTERATYERSLQICRMYQENTKASSQLQAEILKGVQTGESPLDLLLKASEAIALMTSNKFFYEQVKCDLISIYGKTLLSPAPLLWELKAARDRLERLRRAMAQEETTDGKQRIQAAVKAHCEKIEKLQHLIRQAPLPRPLV